MSRIGQEQGQTSVDHKDACIDFVEFVLFMTPFVLFMGLVLEPKYVESASFTIGGQNPTYFLMMDPHANGRQVDGRKSKIKPVSRYEWDLDYRGSKLIESV